MTSKCDKCYRYIYDVLNGKDHTDAICEYYQIVRDMFAKKWVIMEEDDSLVEIINAGTLPVKINKWMINPSTHVQGYVKYIYAPSWLKDSIDLYYQHKFADMTLVEFLEKMHK